MFNDSNYWNSSEMANYTNDSNSSAIVLYEHMYGTAEGKIVLYTSLFLVYIVGPVLAIGIVLYENFGGDRQKRTIVNRLLSFGVGNIAVYCVLSGTFRVIRDVCGLLDYRMMVWINSIASIIKVAGLFSYNQMTIWRFLFIVVWRRIKFMDDEFLMRFLGLSTYMISFMISWYGIPLGFLLNDGLLIKLTKEDMDASATDKR